jgi:regulator of replication initiation timing
MLQSVADNREAALLNQIEARNKDIDDLREEVASLEAQRDKFRNSLGERVEEVQMLRQSNAELSKRVGELLECQKDSRRLDYLQECSVEDGSLSLHLPGKTDIREFVDSRMKDAEERRQDRISELQAELFKLCRENGKPWFDATMTTDFLPGEEV